ncbi:MAG TPA: circularly permuted type 2 ATP-grasp protein, partial [Acidobacteriaceae bacterium]|nr:circularly permuted type 2 ATP-grasp protein [Acidobacteriaceae bacterium]
MTGDLYESPLPYGRAYDESSADGVAPRPHWAALMDQLRALGPEEIEQRWTHAERRIRENGITYNIYGDPRGAARLWKIDLVPFLIPAAEWRTIEAGIIQRATLLSRLLEDIYGPQTLLSEGRLPAALLYGNPAFLRPLAGVKVPPQSYLQILAVDLARSPDGQWWVLSHRTQAPSGSGYALENRLIVSDLLPELFRASNVMRLAPFFRAQRDALTALAGCPNPRIVLLTPGPHNETYFEHSYLAKYLGFTLVEGRDLTVRDRIVFLKTVSGLERVDVILRRVDDHFCDPLELRGDSLLGVSGLVEAIAAGNVKVANALGSGVIESAAILPFLPGLARHLLNEELKLPSVATWWCGQPSALQWVIDHLESVVVKPAFSSLHMEPVFGSDLKPAEREKFLERLRSRPHEYVAQEQVQLSTAPVWEYQSLHSRSLVLRTYVLNTGTGWLALPGGLVRVSETDGSVVSMQRGGHSKDAWVLSDTPVDTFSLLRPRDEPVELRRVSLIVPSSVADNTFWLGRYVERAEDQVRILRTMIPRVHRADEAELGSLIALLGCFGSRHSKRNSRKHSTFPALEKEL